ncbi:MAG: MG2 domain-containing protein [Ignavibacteriaceae bacterium]
MQYLKIWSLILILPLLFFRCSSGNSVSIERFSPEGEVSANSIFTIEFSENLAPSDVIDKWLNDEFIVFEPAIKGKFKWTARNKLIFSPDFPLQPIQAYKAEVTDKVLFKSGLSSDFEEYEFHTPDFDVTSVEFFWNQIPYQSYKISVQANIHFTYPVPPEKLKEYLVVKRDGGEVNNYIIHTESPSEVIAISFGEINQKKEEQDLSVTVKEGLISALGKKPLQNNRTFEEDLPPITELAITGVSSGFDGSNGWILVNTTQTVDEQKLKNYISIKPGKHLNYFVNENSFRLEGNFTDVQSAELIIKKGLPGLFGGTLQFEFEQEVSFVNLKPSVNFADKKGIYLLRGGLKNLEVNAVNVPSVEVEVSQVFQNNILYFLDRYSYSYNDDYYDYGRSYYVSDYGKHLYTEKVDLKNSENWVEKFTVNLDKALDQKYRGIYVVNVRSEEEGWISDGKIISLSDLGIIAKKSDDQLLVFVNSISSAEPVGGVAVNLISSNNQVLLTGETNGDGAVTFTDIKGKINDFRPELITVEKGDDFNYLALGQTYIETSRFDVGGNYNYSSQFTTFIYSERNLYRPGNKVNLNAIIRNDELGIEKDIAVLIKIITPSGKTFGEYKKTLNKEGSLELSLDIPTYAQTGEYAAEFYSGPDQIIGSYRFSVEEFLPDKIRVNLKESKKTAYPGDIVSVNIDAEFLYGAKASGLKYQAESQYKHKPYQSKNYPAFDFSNSSTTNTDAESNFIDGVLDDNGNAAITDTIPPDITGGGIIENNIYVSVFDLTGRTVNRYASIDIFPKKYFIGINAPGYYFGTNEKLSFKLVAVNEKDAVVNNFRAKAALVRYEWHTVLKKDYSNRYYYASEEKEIKEWEKNTDLSGGIKDFSFSVSHSGKYQLRIYKEGSEDYQAKSFYAYGWGASTASSFQVDKEGRVEIVADKKSYEPGEEAKLLFTAPFSGKMLLTIERNNVYEYEYIDIDSKSAEVKIDLPEKYMPNVYVSATLFKKHNTDNSTPFLVGHGFISISVEKKKNHLPVTITAPSKIKPDTKQVITVKTVPEKDVYITLAAVDEGILQIKNYVTPDPYAYMYGKRGLNVSSYDLYKLLLPEIVSRSSSPGGDAAEELRELGKRTNPVTTKRVKLLSYFSGIKKSDGNGIVKINLDIPRFNGDIRLMAVAYTGQRFGNGEAHMKVMDDLIIEPEMPRFLSINDSLVSTVTLVNTTSAKKNVSLSAASQGPLNIISPKSVKVSVPPNSTKSVNFAIKSYKETGKGKIVFETSGDVKVKEEIEIGVRPISPLFVESGSGNIKAGSEIKVEIPSDYMKGTQNTTLTISKFPAVKLAKHLKYLVGYPHGCIEQTVSKLFPQIYFEELAKLVAPELYRTNNPVYYVKEGISKIESMQLYDGSMAYWQGGDYPSWWGSVYAAHFLLEARRAGFAVSENVLKKLLSFIEKKSREGGTYQYATYRNNSRLVTQIAYKEIIYGLYVLALGKRADISTMNYYKARPHLLSADTRYLLAGAFALSGKWNTYYEVVPAKFTAEKTDKKTGGNFDSEVRTNAIMLNVLLEVQPSNPQIPYMIKHVSKLVDNIYSTQERSFAFLALGKAAAINADNDMKVDIIVKDKKIGLFNNSDITITGNEINSGNIILKSSGKGEVYYFWNTEGIKTSSKLKEEDSFIQVRRHYYDYRTGVEINNNFTQGQLIVCKISLLAFNESVENVVITDLLPSCFEIENPRLSTSTELRWKSDNPVAVQNLDIRDDRLILFTGATNVTREYYYMLRVVNKGKFQLPVIGAEAMYAPEFHSYNGADIIRVN